MSIYIQENPLKDFLKQLKSWSWIMSIQSIAEAYRVLQLEDPISFQNKKMNYYISEIHKGLSESEDMYLKESFLYMRQTGKTTYKCVDAAVRLLDGKDVMFICHNMSMRKRVEEIIKKYTWTLGLENQINHLDVGRLEVRSANSIEGIKLETTGWGGDIIIDIY